MKHKILRTLIIRLLVGFFLGMSSACLELSASLDLEDSASDQNTETSADSEEVVESFSEDIRYFYTPSSPNSDLSDTPAIGLFVEITSGLVTPIDPEKNFPIDLENEESIPTHYEYDDISDVKAENDHPDAYGCALPASPSDTSTFTTGGVGTNALPARDATWDGYGQGGCGTWATAMCDRILGETEADSEVTKEEWNEIAGKIKQNNGGSKMSEQSKYYEDKGYCVEEKKFGGGDADYDEMVEKIDDSCDVKLFLFKRNADGTYTNGHVETVTGADAGNNTATTNSWGKEASVSGGSDGDFGHSEDGTGFQDSEGNPLWPADSTEVWVQYVCECGFFEGIGKALGF